MRELLFGLFVSNPPQMGNYAIYELWSEIIEREEQTDANASA